MIRSCFAVLDLAAGLSAADPRPNVLFVLADDLNCDLGCYGYAAAKTPNLDKLAARGVRFDRAYCQYPVCNPSRVSVMTGVRPEALGVMGNRRDETPLPAGVVTLGQWLRKQGYFTAKAGKIYHGDHYPDSWDEAAAWGGDNDRGKGNPLFGFPPKKRDAALPAGESLSGRVQDVTADNTPDGAVARQAVELMTRAARGGKPFFLAVGFHAPHLPLDPPRAFFDLHPPASIKLPDEPLDALTATPPTALVSAASTARPLTPDVRRTVVAAYSGMVSFLDANVGTVLDAVDRLGLLDNTVVVFVSDHGFHLGDHGGLWSKKTLFDRAARVPLVVAGPPAARGRACGRTVEMIDLVPTVADLCGVPAPPVGHGRSLKPLLGDPAAAWDKPARTVVVNNDRTRGTSVRTERYTYTEWDGGAKGVELYDRAADPDEYRNLAADPAAAATVAAMKKVITATEPGKLPPAAK